MKRLIIVSLMIMFTVSLYVFNTPRTYAQSPNCRIGEKLWVNGPYAEARTRNFSTETDSDDSIYNPPTGWTIINYEIGLVSNWGLTTKSIDFVATNSRFVSSRALDDNYDHTIDALGEYVDPNTGQSQKYQGRINERRNQHLNYVRNLESNHQALVLKVKAKGHGQFSDKTSNIKAYVKALIECIGSGSSTEMSLLQQDLLPGYPFSFQNDCHKSIRLVLRYKNLADEWVTDGYWDVRPNQLIWPGVNGVPLRSNNNIFYYYAEIPNTDYTWTGEHSIEFDSRTLKAREARLEPISFREGYYYGSKQYKRHLSISCSNL